MSIEAALAKLTAAVEANTEALLAGGGGTTKSTGTKSTGTTKKTTTSKKKTGPAIDDVAEAFATYMKGGSKDERAEAKANVKAILDHFGAARITEMEEDNLQEAMDLLAKFKDGEDPLGDGDEDEDGDDLM